MTATWLPTTPVTGGRGDVRGRFADQKAPVAAASGDVRGRFTARTEPGAACGGDVRGRLAVSTAGAWSLYSLAVPTVQGDGVGSC
jgi:hypothetical protein